MFKRLLPAVFALALSAFSALPALTPAAAAASCDASTVRFASTSNNLYVTGPVTCTLTQLSTLTKAPLTQIDPAHHVWYLGANLFLQQGATLNLVGSNAGGDVDQLRLKSNNTTGGIVFIRADWGNIVIQNTQVTSWDSAAGGPDTETDTYGRAFIHVRSSLDANGVTAHESRMDIVNSEVSYLGSHNAEAYGLVWKVIGSQPGIYDKVNVYGSVVNSHIHNNYFGIYTFGAYGMNITGSEFDHNHDYGIDPHDDSDYLTITGNYSHHNGTHGIICSQRCDHLTISGNRSEYNGGHGIMLHRRMTDSVVENNTIVGNGDSGIAVFDSSNNIIRGNTLTGNQNGLRLSVGAAGNTFSGNIITGSTAYGIYTYKGSDAPTSGDGRPKNNTFTGNTISGSLSYAMKIGDSDNNLFDGNTFTGNKYGFLFERSTGNEIRNSQLGGLKVETDAETAAASTILSNFGTANIVIDSGATVQAYSTTGAIYNVTENLGTAVTPTGSVLNLTYANIGTSTTLTTRALQASVGSGSVAIDPTTWTGSQKSWTTKASVSSLAVNYTVGDLAANTTYRLLKNGAQFGTATTNGSGVLSFGSVAGTTGTVTYLVTP